MRHYELVVILSPTLSQQEATSAWDAIKQLVSDRGAEVTQEERWGMRRLAYPIRKGGQAFLEGNYCLTRFSTDEPLSGYLESYLKLSENVLRSLLVTAEAPKPVPPQPEAAVAAQVEALRMVKWRFSRLTLPLKLRPWKSRQCRSSRSSRGSRGSGRGGIDGRGGSGRRSSGGGESGGGAVSTAEEEAAEEVVVAGSPEEPVAVDERGGSGRRSSGGGSPEEPVAVDEPVAELETAEEAEEVAVVVSPEEPVAAEQPVAQIETSAEEEEAGESPEEPVAQVETVAEESRQTTVEDADETNEPQNRQG